MGFMILSTCATLLYYHCRSCRSAKPSQRRPGPGDTRDAAAIRNGSLRMPWATSFQQTSVSDLGPSSVYSKSASGHSSPSTLYHSIKCINTRFSLLFRTNYTVTRTAFIVLLSSGTAGKTSKVRVSQEVFWLLFKTPLLPLDTSRTKSFVRFASPVLSIPKQQKKAQQRFYFPCKLIYFSKLL